MTRIKTRLKSFDFVGTVRCLLISGHHEYTSLLPVVHSWKKLKIRIILIILALPDFGRSVNPISTRGNILCQPNYYWHPRIFRPSDGPALETCEKGQTRLKSLDFIGTARCLLISGPHGFLQLWS